MSVIRVNHSENYTVMGNWHLRDRRLSLKAKGLLSIILSLPNDWDYTVSGLSSICKEGESAVETALAELKSFGYMTVEKRLPGETVSGRIEYDYTIYEQPVDTSVLHKQGGEKQGVEILPVENRPQLNTNILSKDNRFIGRGENLPFAESEKLQEAFDNWVQYKIERHETYKPQGLKSLITQIREAARTYGIDAMVDIINESMASNYRGIIFDRLKKMKQYNHEDGGGGCGKWDDFT